MNNLFLVATYRPDNNARLEQAIASYYPHDHYAIGRGQWLVTAHGTATGVAQTLDILADSGPVSGSYVFCVSEYVGRAKPDMGEWMDSKAPRSADRLFKSEQPEHNLFWHGKRLIINLVFVLGIALVSFVVLSFFFYALER